MVGNDIVDIAQAKKDSNWQRPRFLDKIFTINEQCIIHSSNDKTEMVWRLWSIKEAAYKLYVQQNPSRFYNPKKFECFIENTSTWKVNYYDFTCHVSTQITTDYIISEARLSPYKTLSEVVVFKDKNLKIQGQILREKLSERVSEKQNISVKDIKFQKSDYGIPTLRFNSKTVNVSLTYHGRFGALVFGV